jgi:phage protein U
VSFESTKAKTYTREKGHYTLEGVNTTNSIANRKGTKQNSTYNDVTR